MNSQQAFSEAVATITTRIAGKNLDGDLQTLLDESFPPGGEAFDDLAELCRQGIDEGWLCDVDVVLMDDIKGPYHGHPNGEIDMIIPETAGAKFDGRGQGWVVYEPETAHYPTVTDGKAIVLYLLPEGEIDFTRTPSQAT
jgi:hypothetical protein